MLQEQWQWSGWIAQTVIQLMVPLGDFCLGEKFAFTRLRSRGVSWPWEAWADPISVVKNKNGLRQEQWQRGGWIAQTVLQLMVPLGDLCSAGNLLTRFTRLRSRGVSWRWDDPLSVGSKTKIVCSNNRCNEVAG